jgi:hypothetical protein
MKSSRTDLFQFLDIDQSEDDQQSNIDVHLGDDLCLLLLLLLVRFYTGGMRGNDGIVNLHRLGPLGDGGGRGGGFGSLSGEEGREVQ